MTGPRDARNQYRELLQRVREVSLLGSCLELLGWDEETYMPRGGVAHRGEQAALLAGIKHERATDPRIGELIGACEASSLVAEPLSPAAVNVRELRWRYDRRTRLPKSLVVELARTTTIAQKVWEKAHHGADFSVFEPWLERLVGLQRDKAACLARGGERYDALLEDFEPGARTAEVSSLFAILRRELRALVDEITRAGPGADPGILRREYPVERQKVFCEAIATGLGFDFQRGRVDVALHPSLCNIGPGDCRITTRYNTCDLSEGLFSVLHELGHAMYEQGLDPEQYGAPMGEAASYGVHESQSRLWENLVGRSRPFWEHFFPLAREIFHGTLHGVSIDDFHRAVNRVAPTLTRSLADEVTYNLHVFVRFDIERALIDGTLHASEVPAAWAEGYRAHLGIVPGNHREGCLQDGHWAAGMFGYFPVYVLGNVFAAQLFAKAREDIPDIDGQFQGGDFGGLLTWLRERVHRHGRRYPVPRLIEQATGRLPSPEALIAFLRAKYGELYGL